MKLFIGLLLSALAFGSTAAELYLPCCSNHIGDEGRKKPLNENNHGIGYENDHGYFGLVLKDSLNNPSWAVGKAWRWRTNSDPYIGIGASAFVMMRANVDNYTPFPAVLPSVTVGYGRAAVDFTFIPKTSATKYGAVFAMFRIKF